MQKEIRVKLNYCKQGVEIDGVRYPIYYHRKEREWRHLDLWQYKTYIVARVPRYQKDGKVVSVEVPWANADARLSWLLEKKTIETLMSMIVNNVKFSAF